MAKFQKYYKCEVCGNIVQVVHESFGELVCCNKPMVKLEDNSVDAAGEKHVPVIEKTDSGIVVKVGSVDHPMEEKHYIEWIEVTNGAWTQKKFLKPGQKPHAEFYVPYNEDLVAREYCSVHGLWKSE